MLLLLRECQRIYTNKQAAAQWLVKALVQYFIHLQDGSGGTAGMEGSDVRFS